MLTHWIWLTLRPGLGTRGCARLLKRYGTAERIFSLTEEMLTADMENGARLWKSLADKSLTEAQEILRRCEALQIRIVTYADANYPERLRCITDPPVLLYYRGELPCFDQEAVIAVVGSRRCSTYGLRNARQFSRLIARSGGLVISGGARGIDTLALQGALDSAMPVACVVGCGLDVNYPTENAELFRTIEGHGCMISEYPPGTPPLKQHFPVRNRILSGLSVGVLVVEAPEHSGALITVREALDQGRDVFAIPGNVGVRQCEGSNRLLREGAIMAENGWDVVCGYAEHFPQKLCDGRSREACEALFRYRYGNALPVYSPVLEPGTKKDIDNPPAKAYIEKKEPDPPVKLTEDEAAVFSGLKDGEAHHADALVVGSGLPTQRVMTALTMLQIKGQIVKLPGNRFRRKD